MAQQRRKLNMYEPAIFCLRVQGELNKGWCDYFDTQSLTVCVDESGSPATILISAPVDQSALIGMINHLNALGVPLISVECLPMETVVD
jgi:hypothetical protein